MENLQSYLCLRCSDKDKWLLVYFASVLGCNVCVVESFYYTSCAFLMLKTLNQAPRFADNITHILLCRLIACLGPSESEVNHTTAQWTKSNAQLQFDALHKVDGFEITIQCNHVNGSFLRTSFSGHCHSLSFSYGYANAPKQLFKSGLFEWFVNSCIEETVKLYLS